MNVIDSSPGPMNVLFDPNATRLETVPKDFIGDMDPGKIWGSNGQWVRIIKMRRENSPIFSG